MAKKHEFLKKSHKQVVDFATGKLVNIADDFTAKWTEAFGGTPPKQVWVDEVVNFDLSKETFLSIDLEFGETMVTVALGEIMGYRVIKTLFSNYMDLHRNCINFRTFELISKIDKDGKRRFAYFEDMPDQELELMRIFTLLYKIRACWEDDSVKVLSVDEVMKETIPEEIKSLLFAHPAMNLSQYLKKEDTYVHKEMNNASEKAMVYDLFGGTIMDVKVKYVRTYDASSDRQFFLAVDKKYKKAKNAIASLLQVPQDMIPHIKEIARQGEKYYISWKDISLDSKEFAKKSATEEVSLTGKQYFDLLAYES